LIKIYQSFLTIIYQIKKSTNLHCINYEDFYVIDMIKKVHANKKLNLMIVKNYYILIIHIFNEYLLFYVHICICHVYLSLRVRFVKSVLKMQSQKFVRFIICIV